MSEVKDQSSNKGKSKVKGLVNKTQYVESVIVDSKPAFLMTDISTGEKSVLDKVLTPNGIVRPLKREEMGYIPFEFTSAEIEEWKSVVFDREQLLDDILEVVQQYLDVSFQEQILFTGDILLTYCLDWTSTTHFLFFVGDRGSGKTNATRIVSELGYRCMSTAQMSPANIYNFLSTDEEGCGTICEDEADDIDNNTEKLRIYKSSYAKGQKIPKMDMYGKKVQLYYNTYCMVFFSGEGLPKNQALRERIVAVYMIKGNPKDNIKRPKDLKWKEEHIAPLRKKLLMWKLQNIGKKFSTIDSGLTGRDQELFEDFLSVFAGTKHESDARDVVNHYVNKRQQAIADSLEGIIFRILEPLLDENRKIEFQRLYDILTTSDELSEYQYKINRNVVSKILLEKFQAVNKPIIKTVNGIRKQTTYYRFDERILKVLSEKYRINDL